MRNLTVVVALVVVFAGCAGPIRSMREVPAGQEMNTTPPPGKTAIVFMRPSGFGWAISSSVYELKDDGDLFIAIVPAKRKLVYLTNPGSTRFMVIGESADFLGAELEAGKTYYALVTPRMGMWKARFSLRPVTEADAEEVSGWLKDCTWIENTPESQAWAKENWSSIQAKKAEYIKEWDAKRQADAARRRRALRTTWASIANAPGYTAYARLTSRPAGAPLQHL